MSDTSTNPVQNSTIMSFVNSSIGTNTANFLGTYDAHDDLGLTIVDETDPTNAQIATALATYLAGQSITASNNDYVFVSLNFPATVDTDEFRRFKYSDPNNDHTGSWEYEYTLNNSSFTAEQWASINSLVTNTSSPKVGVDVKDINAHLGDSKIHVPANTIADQLLKSNANGQATWSSVKTINSDSILASGNIDLMKPDMSNINVSGTPETGKTVIWNGTGWEYGEAGKVDDVRINGSAQENSIVNNKIAVIPITVTTVSVTEVD